MKHKSKFLIVLLSAAITIGGLIATVGKPWYVKHHGHCHPTEKVSDTQKF